MTAMPMLRAFTALFFSLFLGMASLLLIDGLGDDNQGLAVVLINNQFVLRFILIYLHIMPTNSS